ncbi:glutamine synthetase/guanido kinase [Xylariaceae sp. FL0662B]|nr:glutamine synthetase/guanido kinase [Xylariaceae sp. FL0662B]
MASSAYGLGQLNAAIDTTPLIDNHAHPLLKVGHLSKHPLLSITSEANGDALHDSKQTLAHIRAVNQLSQVLGCKQTWDDVVASVEKKRADSRDGWVKRCMEGIEALLIDDGLDIPGQAEDYASHSAFTKSKCKRIVRVETVAADIIARHCASGITSDDRSHLEIILLTFEDEIRGYIADPEVVGFKSIVCYRGGLDIPRFDEINGKNATSALQDIMDAGVLGTKPSFYLKKRLEHSPLNHILVHLTARLIQQSGAEYEKPIQFHTGLGDNDITLTKSSPSHLQTFIREYPTVPIVLLHAGYPWTRETAYLAAVYPNVYADIGEVIPCLSRDGQEGVLKQMLEVCPWSKILCSTDAHGFPEMYLIATMQIRSVLKTVLGNLVQTQQLDEAQAVRLVQDIMFTNSKTLYNLQTETTLPSFAQLTTVSGTDWTNQTVLSRLRASGARYLRIYWHDYTSSAKCRLIPIQQIYRTLESGKPVTLSITKASLGLLQTDTMIPQITATGAYTLRPDWSSLRPGPVDGHASCYGAFTEPDGAEEPLCPRTLLRKTVERAASHDLTFLLGFEVEFVVLERNADASSGSPDKYRPLRHDGHAWSSARALADWGRAGGFATAVDEILARLDEAGIAPEQLHAESAPGQFELVLPARPPMEACDALLHARQILESAAARHGFRVTLHPKPFAAACGSASHVHVSVASPRGDDRTVYEAFYAGILGRLRALLALTYPLPASYERMVDSCWAGGRWVTWGTQNKEAPLRKCQDGHWEVKVLDGLANPYFAVAALLAAGTDGILRKKPLTWGDCAVDPAHLTAARRQELGVSEMLPATLREALKALEDDVELGELLHPKFVRRYIDVKNAELEMLEAMSPEERRQWMLERY